MQPNRENFRVLICPGIHDPALTQAFMAHLQPLTAIAPPHWWIVPTDIPPYAGPAIAKFLQRMASSSAGPELQICIIGFSAGAVGAIAAAQIWQWHGGRIHRLMAIDGWGMPLWGSITGDRLSHDAFTCATSNLLGAGQRNFYADPAVEHLEMWRSPHRVTGWEVWTPLGWPWVSARLRTTAAEFMAARLQPRLDAPEPAPGSTVKKD